MIAIAVAVTASAVFLYPYVGKELVPDDDQGQFSINVRLPRGTSYPRTEEFIAPIAKEVLALPELRRVSQNVNPGQASFSIIMTPLEDRNISQQELMRRARSHAAQIPGGAHQRLGKHRHFGRLVARGGGPVAAAAATASISSSRARTSNSSSTRFSSWRRSARSTAWWTSTPTSSRPSPSCASPSIARAPPIWASTSIRWPRTCARWSAAKRSPSSRTATTSSSSSSGSTSRTATIRSAWAICWSPPGPGKTVKVSDVATLTHESGPASIDRYNRQRQISVNANIDRVPLGEVIAAARVKVDELHLRPGYQAVFGGSARALAEASNNFAIAIVLAVAFIYMVLASQFNSFVHPLTIMTALPLSLPAGLLALMAFGMTLNVYSAIGLMMLFGIVKKNSILQVDYTNTLRAQGMERHDALIAANHVRLRPILMTTLAIVAGMLPIAFGRGAGAGSRASMAVTIIGGQVLCLLLTLLITPVVYSCFDDLREWSPVALVRKLRTKGGAQRPAET